MKNWTIRHELCLLMPDFGRTDWLRWFLPIFACRGGPGSAARCGGGPRGTQKLIFFSARTDHYENIFEAFSLPARTFTKIFSKRFFCPRGPLRNIFEAFFRPDYGEATIGCTGRLWVTGYGPTGRLRGGNLRKHRLNHRNPPPLKQR